MPNPYERYCSKKYLTTSKELLSPEVGAVEIGLLISGKYQEVYQKMSLEARERGIRNPLMVVDLVFKEGKISYYGSTGQPYPITEEEWEEFAADVLDYCGDKIPKVYMLDGDKYAVPI